MILTTVGLGHPRSRPPWQLVRNQALRVPHKTRNNRSLALVIASGGPEGSR